MCMSKHHVMFNHEVTTKDEQDFNKVICVHDVLVGLCSSSSTGTLTGDKLL